MSETIICQSECHGLPSEGEIMTFSYYHEKCFTFPAPYIEALARHDMAQYVEWPNGVWPNSCWGRSEKTIHVTPLSRISKSTQWGRVRCSECWEPLHPDKTELPTRAVPAKQPVENSVSVERRHKETVAQQSFFDLEGAV
jgi:hypothetical protein